MSRWIAPWLLGSVLGCVNNDGQLSLEREQAPDGSTPDGSTSVEQASQALKYHGAVGRKLMIIGTQTDVMVGSVTADAIFVDRLIADVGGKIICACSWFLPLAGSQLGFMATSGGSSPHGACQRRT